jgi:predicted ATPase/DNA-binding SARP family transcriptional activator
MPLAIQFLGTPQFQLDGVPVTASRRAVVALLAYLTVTGVEHPGQRFSRDSLAELFWTDYDLAKGLSNLRHTLWEVTQFLGEGWVVAEHEVIYLNPRASFMLDVTQFRSLLRQAAQPSNPAQRIPLLRNAVELYRGDFMGGFSLKEGPNFSEWVLSKAQTLHHEFASALDMLVEDYRVLNQSQSGIPYAQRLIGLDPMNEDAHRKLMQLYALTDQQNAALQQYRVLEKLLRKELNVDPQPETRDLYKKIRKGEFQPVLREKKIPSLTRPRHNLPVHLTTFIGREKERDELSRLISQNRLVTLIGAGGIGKTRLALQTGQTLTDHFSDGVWFIPLEAITDEDVVSQTVASFLNVPQLSQQDVMETLVDELRSKRLLLILDNCEHLLDACARLAETLLKTCPEVKILATSREALRLEGEAFYQLAPLAIPDHHETQSVGEVGQYESVQLFLERARLGASGLELTQGNAKTIVNICDRLDGIPLAIELAAAHVDIFTLGEILHQLNRSFDLLVSNTRSALPRHQTMHTSIEWGWNLLSEPERAFIRHLSVFIGGWTLLSAQATGVTKGPELTRALVKKSFVVVYPGTADETRYGFHEVIRAYAQEKLIESGEEKTMRDRHLEYFLELVQQFEPALRGVDQDLWMERLLVERDNIRAALEWAARTDLQAGLYLSNRLRVFWENYEGDKDARWLLIL